jgi:hypothetical protein
MKGSNMAAGSGFFLPSWQDGEPVFTHQDTILTRALELGCFPVYHEFAWVCRCRDGAFHGVTSHYPEITLASLNRVKRESLGIL